MVDGGGVQALNHPSGEKGREMSGVDFLRLVLLPSGCRHPFPLQRAPELFRRQSTYGTQALEDKEDGEDGCGLFSGP